MRTPRPAAAVLTVATLLALGTLQACGGDDGSDRSDQEQKAIDSLTARMKRESEAEFTQQISGCFAEHLVDDVGLEQLVKDQLLTEDYEASSGAGAKGVSAKTAEAYGDATVACIDWEEFGELLKKDKATTLTDAQIDAAVTCLDNIGDQTIHDSTRDQALRQQTAATQTFTTEFTKCFAQEK
ncbi:hypothetical protein [Nocardioides speluncae]|uniref:hypothetical protein n=1 Tax=Nocardioides speluncae TaxID=2670337 RepID=UPI000D695A6A|nr:hypothetical protein [Nocardioides speluncae]